MGGYVTRGKTPGCPGKAEVGPSEGTGKPSSDAEGGHLWGYWIQPRPQGQQQESRPEAPKTRQANTELGPFRQAWELTVHGFLLEEGRHGQGPRPGGPARPASGKGQEGKGPALGGVGVARPTGRRRGRGLQAGPAEGGIRTAHRSRVARSSGDCELTHFLEKSLLGDACARGARACALRRLKPPPLP